MLDSKQSSQRIQRNVLCQQQVSSMHFLHRMHFSEGRPLTHWGCVCGGGGQMMTIICRLIKSLFWHLKSNSRITNISHNNQTGNRSIWIDTVSRLNWWTGDISSDQEHKSCDDANLPRSSNRNRPKEGKWRDVKKEIEKKFKWNLLKIADCIVWSVQNTWMNSEAWCWRLTLISESMCGGGGGAAASGFQADELHVEGEGCVGWNDTWMPFIAIGIVWWADQLSPLAHTHLWRREYFRITTQI